MIGKELSKITQEDLQNLIDNVVLEGKTIEYKGALPGDTPDEKKEFLADVSSFANAGGGDIIFGITEDRATREPKGLEGIELANSVDQEKARLDNMLRDGVEPRMPAVHIHPVPLVNGKKAIIIRVGKSWVSPHRVTYKGHDKFYSRNSSGKYPLDVGELRTAFTMSETITDRIRRFREERIARLYANETPVPMNDGPKIGLHLLPVVSFGGQSAALVTSARRLIPMRGDSWHTRYTLEGFLNYCQWEDVATQSYVHLYRNGIIESVEGSLIQPISPDKPDENFIDSFYERLVVEVMEDYIGNLKELEIPTPVFVYLTLLGTKGRKMHHGSRMASRRLGHVVDRDVLMLPEVTIEDYDISARQLMRPVFDAVWNACGFARSLNYNDKGEWTVGKR